MGRKRYELWLREESLLLLAGWARDGLEEAEIARRVGVRPQTLRAWRERYEPIDRALRRGRETVDFEVENALLRAACGYEYQEVTREPLSRDGEPVLDAQGRPRTRMVKVVTKYAPPSLPAASFWLKNRRAAMWGDRAADPGADESSNLIEAIRASAAEVFDEERTRRGDAR